MNIRISLITKFTFATSLILLAFMGVLDSINLKNFRKLTIEYAASNAEQAAEIINQSAYDAMMRNDKISLFSMIDRIAKSENIDHIRMIDQKGKVVYSSNREEIGSAIGKHADECIMCHNPATGLSGNRSRIITTRSGQEALGFTKAVYNRPECIAAACHFHSSGDSLLGFLDISISLETLRVKSHQYRLEFVMLTCLLLLLIGILVTALTYYLVDLPLQRLVRHSTQVAAGDFATKVRVSSRDELGELAETFNRMTESLGTADRELKGWADSLEQKVEERSREIRLMEEQLRRSEKLASLGTLVAGVAHEINNPLTGILLYASIISSDKRLDAALQPDVERVIAETQRCAGIVKSMLEFSRESHPEISAVDLGAILDEAVSLFRNQPDFDRITIRKHYAEELPQIAVDFGQIRQVCINLIINANHAMRQGGELEICTWLTADGKTVCASLKDNGDGITAENLSRVFDPFFTTKSEGTGLGLSISYGIINNNGGEIRVESVVGEGTTFTLLFPAVA